MYLDFFITLTLFFINPVVLKFGPNGNAMCPWQFLSAVNPPFSTLASDDLVRKTGLFIKFADESIDE